MDLSDARVHMFVLFFRKKCKMEKCDIIISKFGKNDKDTGSFFVQIALITERIRHLTEHLKTHKKDCHSRMEWLG